jgi:hypothetical protein
MERHETRKEYDKTEWGGVTSSTTGIETGQFGLKNLWKLPHHLWVENGIRKGNRNVQNGAAVTTGTSRPNSVS